MAVTTRTNQLIKNMAPRPQQWRWYHGVIFYAIVQVLTFGLSGLVSAIKGPTGKNLRENIFGNPAYFNELKQSIFAPPSWAFGPAWLINNISVIWGTGAC